MSQAITRNRGSSSSTGIIDEEVVVPIAQAKVSRRRSAPVNEPPILREGSPEMLVHILMERYFISEEVAARFNRVGVAVFLRLSEEFITGIVTENNGSLFNAALVAAAKEDMVSRLEGMADEDVLPLQQVPGGAVEQAQEGNIQAGAAGGAAATALNDPYIEGEDEEGKAAIYAMFGVVGGLLATECSRMQINTRRGETTKGISVIYIPELSVELRTTEKDDLVNRARQWLVVVRVVDKPKWEPLGKRNWSMDIKAYMVSMILGLGLENKYRRPHQLSAPYLNNIKACGWATNHRIMEQLLAGNWNEGGVQISTFESTKGAARASSTTSDDAGRNGGLKQALENLMWYMAGYFHEGFLRSLDGIVTSIETSEYLYLLQGRLLNFLIDKIVGGVFRAIPIANSIELGGVIYMLGGPRLVAAALVAASNQVAVLFGDRAAMRQEQIVLDEEAANNKANARLVSQILQESPAKSEGLMSASKRKKMEEEERVKSAKKLAGALAEEPVGYGSGISYPVKQEKDGKAGDKAIKPKIICNRHIGSQLGVLDAAGRVVRCPKTAKNCIFAHANVDTVTFAEAMRGILAMSDKETRLAIKAKAEELKNVFKK
jgi:hypothetical protein